MKKFKYEFWVNDDFETGDCSDCPFEQWEWYDDDGYNDCYSYCAIDSVDRCPLIEVKN